jgi:hypothetical protein
MRLYMIVDRREGDHETLPGEQGRQAERRRPEDEGCPRFNTKQAVEDARADPDSPLCEVFQAGKKVGSIT